jgi:uroporphyrinogen III methyltransferase/synthase
MLVQQLENAGATVIIAPTIEIVPPDDRTPLLKAVRDLASFDWVVFGSANAVEAFVRAATDATADDIPKAQLPIRMPPTLKVAAVGSRTAERLQSHGIDVTLVPDEFRAEALVRALTAQGPIEGVRVLLPRSEIGRDTLANGLRSAGALVTDVVAYRTVRAVPASGTPDVRGMLVNGDIDAVMFTSGSAIRQFVQIYGSDHADLFRRTRVAVIGPVTAAVAGELGVPVHIQPAAYTTADMVAALAAHFWTAS